MVSTESVALLYSDQKAYKLLLHLLSLTKYNPNQEKAKPGGVSGWIMGQIIKTAHKEILQRVEIIVCPFFKN